MRQRVLLIPDGIRRFARQSGQDLNVCYADASLRLFTFAHDLLRDCEYVGVFPLAAYNLERSRSEVEALLTGGASGMSQVIPRLERRAIVVGDIATLISKEDGFRPILNLCDVNPYDDGDCPDLTQRLIVFLAYDWRSHLGSLFSRWPLGNIPRYPSWSNVLRTGCEGGVFRLSANFLGIEQSLFHALPELFPRISIDDVRAAVGLSEAKP